MIKVAVGLTLAVALLLILHPIPAASHPAQEELTLGVPLAGSLSGTGDERYYQISVGAGEHLFVILDAVDNTNYYDLYIKFGAQPTTTDYDAKGEPLRADDELEIASTQAGTYYIMVRSIGGGGDYAIVAHDNSTFPTLTLGTPTVGNLHETYDIKYYQVSVSAGEHLFVILDAEDNPDFYQLYIKFGALPSISGYDDRGDSPRADQAVEIASTQAGNYYVMVRSTGGEGSYSVIAHDNDTFPTLTLSVAQAGSLQGTYDIKYYQLPVSAGERLLVILDRFDDTDSYELYIKSDALPSTTDYDAKGDSSSSTQAVESANTQANTYYVMVRSIGGGGDYSILAYYARHRVVFPIVQKNFRREATR